MEGDGKIPQRRSAFARRLFLGLTFFNALFFSMIFVVTSLYEATVAGLSGWQLVLVGTTLEVAILVFEIPTGIVADAYSRRLSIIVGFLIMGTGFLVEGSFPLFIPILCAQVLWGLGYTFTSGATQAWLSDEIGEGDANRALLHANQYDLTGSLVGMLLAIPLGNLAVRLPILVGGAALLLVAAVLVFIMPEHGFRPTPREKRSTVQHMLMIGREGIAAARSRPALLSILGVGLTFGIYSEGWDRLWVKVLIDRFTLPGIFGMNDVAFLGLLRAGGMLLAILFSRALASRIDANHPPTLARILTWSTSMLSIGILAFAWSGSLALSVMAFWLVSMSRNVMGPLYDAWINQRLEPRTRATVLSLAGQVDAAGQIIGGPIAALVSLWSIRAALTAAAGLLLPALPLIGRANRMPMKGSAAAGTSPETDTS